MNFCSLKWSGLWVACRLPSSTLSIAIFMASLPTSCRRLSVFLLSVCVIIYRSNLMYCFIATCSVESCCTVVFIHVTICTVSYTLFCLRHFNLYVMIIIIHFVNAAVAVDSSHLTTSSSSLWSSFSPPSNFVSGHTNFVSGHTSTIWLIVCCWPQSHVGDLVRPHLCRIAWHGPWPVWKQFSRDHDRWGRLRPGCQIVGSVTVM